MKGLAATFILFLLIAGHEPPADVKALSYPKADTTVAVVPQAVAVAVPDTIINKIKKDEPTIQTGFVNPVSIVEYAKTLIGTPYLFGSTDPKKGFDCSGFITYVFNHYNIKVPRSSVEFTHVGADVNYLAAKPGDLILFTGTDSTIRVVGHMGIIVSNENNKTFFIHSTSGKQYGVTITELSPYYMSRFVRVARVFPENADRLTVGSRLETVDTNVYRLKTVTAESPKKSPRIKTIKTSHTSKLVKKKSSSTKKVSKKSSSPKKVSKKSSTVKNVSKKLSKK
jgi:hypothetical protein